MAGRCKHDAGVTLHSFATDRFGRSMSDNALSVHSRPQNGYSFLGISEGGGCKWPSQSFVKSHNGDEQSSKYKGIDVLTQLEALPGKSFVNGSAENNFDFIADRIPKDLNEMCYFDDDVGAPTEEQHSDNKVVGADTKFSESLTQLGLRPSNSCGTQSMNGIGLETDRAMDTDFRLDELVWGDEKSENDVSKGWKNNLDIFGNDKTPMNNVCDEQYLLQSLIGGSDEGAMHEYVDALCPITVKPNEKSCFDIRPPTFTELLEVDNPQSDSTYRGEGVRVHNVTKARGLSLSSDSGIGGSIAEFATSPMDTSFSRDDMSISPSSTKDHNSLISKLIDPTTVNNCSDISLTKLEENKTLKDPSENAESKDSKISSKKTAYNAKWGVKVLRAWCSEMSITEDFENYTPTKLNDLLCRFWSEVRKTNGDYYGRNSLFNLRAMINKHLKGQPYCVDFDIVTDERFRSSNDTLEKQLKILKGIGKTITHKEAISMNDLKKMYDTGTLSTANPLALLRKVWFEITLHFCYKKSESQEKLTRRSFRIYRDHNFRAYVTKAPDPRNSREYEERRMYETAGDLCPVRSYQLYLQKLHPQQSRLFQQPRRKSTPSSAMWYGKAPIGEKALQQMMANISEAAKLSKRYTNHCVRTTALEHMNHAKRRRAGEKLPDRRRSTEMYIATPAYPYSSNNTLNPQRLPNGGPIGRINLPPLASYPSNDSLGQLNERPAYTYGMQMQNHEFQGCAGEFHKTFNNSLVISQGDTYKQPYKRANAFPATCQIDGADQNSTHVFSVPGVKKNKMDSPFVTTSGISISPNGNFPENDESKKSSEFSETIICAGGRGGIPEIQSISSEDYATLAKIV